jgi:serralysin
MVDWHGFDPSHTGPLQAVTAQATSGSGASASINPALVDQLNSGSFWYTSSGAVAQTISYGFTTSNAFSAGFGEAAGWSAFSGAQMAAARQMMALWDDLIAPSFVESTGSPNTADIKFSNTTTSIGYAHAYFPGQVSSEASSYGRIAGSVWLNPAYSSGTNNLVTPTSGTYGYMAMMHEMGHSLGLDHGGNYNGGSPAYGNTSTGWLYTEDSQRYTIMSYFSASATGANWGGRYAQTPMVYDILAIQTIYGADTTTRTGNSVYGFNSNLGGQSGGVYDFSLNTNPILCIYDAAGNDTIDLSGWSTSCVLNLAPGSFSSGNNMTYNISIAYSCYIENGIGGSNADVLTGNTLGNLLNGLGGNDTLNGGAGNDTLIGGSGNDTAIYSGAFSSYSVSYNGATATYTITSSAEGVDTATGIEYFQFSDGTRTAAQLIATAPVTPTVSISAVTASAAEGNSGTTIFTFQVTLSAASALAQTVNYSVAGTGAAAASAADFASALSGIVSFAAGETSKTIQVLVAGDTVVELNETFAVTLSGASSGLVLGTAQATATISNDDVATVATATVIKGTSANNVLNGTSGNDWISGLAGNDKLYGGAGDDTLIGGSGKDVLNGGAGSDWVSYAGSSGVTVNLNAGIGAGGDAAGDTYASIENAKGSSFADVLRGSSAANILDGGLGNDILIGGLGADTFRFSEAAFGRDRISDYQDNLDKLSFSLNIADSFDDFVITGNGTKVVTVTHAADSITVVSPIVFTLAADDFIFV